MEEPMKGNHARTALICGLLGCLCYGGGDWLMMYGNPVHHGALSWLTEGVSAIPQWRFNLAMALAFPGIILYGIALFAVETYIREEKHRKVYHWLNAFRLGFTNGLMSESMILWFGIMLIWERRRAAGCHRRPNPSSKARSTAKPGNAGSG